MKYEDALKCWAYQKLKDQLQKNETICMNDISVNMVFVKGYNCCSGLDPDCCCSMAEDPRADVEMSARTTKNRYIYAWVDFGDFDFIRTLKEILEAANGSIEL